MGIFCWKYLWKPVNSEGVLILPILKEVIVSSLFIVIASFIIAYEKSLIKGKVGSAKLSFSSGSKGIISLAN